MFKGVFQTAPTEELSKLFESTPSTYYEGKTLTLKIQVIF